MTQKEKAIIRQAIQKLSDMAYNARGCYETSRSYNYKVLAEDADNLRQMLKQTI